jgi:8-oxo-dGTP pyrophosphatase MutT (NUDIX family)
MSLRDFGLLGRLGGVLLRSPEEPRGVERQFGAIPYRHVDGEIVFLLITARRTGKWIFPKGGPMEGLTPAESAAEEAYEEAGVRGRVAAAPAGHYRTFKARPGKARPGKARRVGEVPVLVEMYPLEVAEQFDDWPEKGERRRHWVTLAEARRLLSEPGLVALAEKIAASARG